MDRMSLEGFFFFGIQHNALLSTTAPPYQQNTECVRRFA
jgi:hypothetical protein